jgi:glycine betaine catabolism A
LDVRGLLRRAGHPADQRAESIGDGSVLPSRDDDGVLRAFANYCRHRGHELLPCGVSAQRPSIVCPCHSRTSALDGSMKTAKGFKGTAGFDDSLWSLVELPVTKWHGLAFVDGSGGAGSLAGALAELDELVAPYKPERLVIRGRHTYNAASN